MRILKTDFIQKFTLWNCWMLLSFFYAASSSCADDGSNSITPLHLAQVNPLGQARSVIIGKDKLTLEIYLKAVDSYFPGLKSAADQQMIASANRLEKQGAFDPLLSDESGYTRMQNTSHIGEWKEVLFNYPKIELPFDNGIRVFGQFRYNPNSGQSPYIGTGEGGEYSAGLLIPLLRGLIYNEQSVAVKEAKFGEQLAAQTFFLTRLDTLLRAGTTFWSWVGSKKKADVSRQIQELSTFVSRISSQQESNGDLAKIYVIESEEDVQRRNADVAQTVRDFQRYSFRLSTFLFDMGGIPLPLATEENVPELPKPLAYSPSDTELMVTRALASRPELKAIDVQTKIAQVQLKLAKNQMLPALNGVVTQGYDTGLNGIGYTYRGQLTFSQPLYMRAARGKEQAAKLKLDKLAQDRQAEAQRIKNEVYDAISAINLAFEKFSALEVQVAKAEQVYQGERQRFAMGDSTVFLIAERERQLNEARVRLIDASVEYHIGVLALKAITTQL